MLLDGFDSKIRKIPYFDQSVAYALMAAPTPTEPYLYPAMATTLPQATALSTVKSQSSPTIINDERTDPDLLLMLPNHPHDDHDAHNVLDDTDADNMALDIEH